MNCKTQRKGTNLLQTIEFYTQLPGHNYSPTENAQYTSTLLIATINTTQ